MTHRTLLLLLITVGWPTCILFGDARAAETKASRLGEKPELARLSSDLLRFRETFLQGKPVADLTRQHPHLRFKEERVGVNIRCWEVTTDLRNRLGGLGLDISTYSERWAQIVGWCPVAALDRIAALPEVSTIRPNYRPYLWEGSVDDQADLSIHVAQARTAFGVDGAGVKVGILSDSFHDTIGGEIIGGNVLINSDPQQSGDLPSLVTILDNGPGEGTDEGAAMGELIHDLAPGAALMFHSAVNSDIDFAQGIGDLRAGGADVIVDDVIYFEEPMYQDGPIAQAAQAAVDSGAAYFSSAGNASDTGVRQTFLDVNPQINSATDPPFPPNATDMHDFGEGDPFADITVPAFAGFIAVMQWNQPFSGSLGSGAQTDLDLFIYEAPSPSANILAWSVDIQAATDYAGDPLEVLEFVNLDPAPRTVFMAVDHYVGVRENLEFRIAILPFGLAGGRGVQALPGWSFRVGIFDQPQIYGHAAAEGAVAVAAVFYGEIDDDGDYQSPNSIINVEPFSSLGGLLPFFFGPTGGPLPGAPVFRWKPEITAPDGTNTTFFGEDDPYDPDAHPNFFGTSASAPHAAAVAALMLDAHEGLSPAQITQILASTAEDIEDPGRDPRSGDGLIHGFPAVEAAVAAVPTPTPVGEASRWEVR
jgi:hypothetical protein